MAKAIIIQLCGMIIVIGISIIIPIIPPLGACAHFGACADHGGGLYARPRAKKSGVCTSTM